MTPVLLALCLAEPSSGAADAPGQDGTGKTAPTEEAIARQSNVDVSEEPKKAKWTRPGSRQRFLAEFMIGPYLPDVDRRYDGPGLGPYAQVFGPSGTDGIADKDPRPGVMPVFGFEWQFIYLAGPLGLGGQVGFFRDKAQALIAAPEPDENARSSADSVTFGMVPVSALLAYRLEYFADRFKVPLIPFLRAGPSYTFWWSRDGSGEPTRNSQGERGRGGVWGWQASAGLMLRMDFIEPGTAKKLDSATGINHFNLFGEFQFSRRDNFGVGNAIALGDATWFAGINLEF
jgi:hypothetical protein